MEKEPSITIDDQSSEQLPDGITNPEQEQQIELDKSNDEIAQQWVDYMTTKEKFDSMVANGEPGISVMEHTTAAGTTVNMYNLSGAPYALLVHGITFDRSAQEFSKNGVNGKKAAEYENDISTWDITKRGEANDNISCSILSPEYGTEYWGSTTSAGYKNGDKSIAVGFSGISSEDIRMTVDSDQGTTRKSEHHRSEKLETPNEIIRGKGIHQGRPDGMAEVVIPRYVGESDVARKPDFIIVNNGQTSLTVDRAIDYFNVPVISIDRKNSTYGSDFVEKASKLIGQNDVALSLEESAQKLDDIDWLIGKAKMWSDSDFDSLPKDEVLGLTKSVIEREEVEFIDGLSGAIDELNSSCESWQYEGLVCDVIDTKSMLLRHDGHDNNLKWLIYGNDFEAAYDNIDDNFNKIIGHKIVLLEQVADKIKERIIFETENATKESSGYTDFGRLFEKHATILQLYGKDKDKFNTDVILFNGQSLFSSDTLYENQDLMENLLGKVDEIQGLEGKYEQTVEALRSEQSAA